MSRLPYSTTRLEGDRINLRSDRLPVRFEHDVRDINDHMDDIVYNVIDIIQERAKENDLRTFYFNMMSDKDWGNRDFEDLVAMIADIIDIAVSDDRFRDVRDAIIPICEEVTTIHIAATTEEFPELCDYIPQRMEREFDRAIELYEKYRRGVKAYRDNGNRIPSGGRGRGRDDRDDRDDRGRGGRANLGSGGRSERGGQTRRDKWERGAVRGGVRGSPQRSISRENRFGNTDQTDRFDDHVPSDTRGDDHARDRDDRNSRTRDEAPQQTRTRRATVQRLPGQSRDSDIEDALAREQLEQGNNQMESRSDNIQEETEGVVLVARENIDAWLPTQAHPHPLAFNHTETLMYVMDATNMQVIPRLSQKDRFVNYYEHASLAFGGVPKDMNRFEEGGVSKRSNKLHESLLKETEVFRIDGTEAEVTYHNRIDYTDDNIISYGLKEAILRLNYRRFSKESTQVNGNGFHEVSLAIGRASILEALVVTSAEAAILEELRQVTSFNKLAEKLRQAVRNVSDAVFLQLDQHLAGVVNHMLRQYLSIPGLRITSFTEDWLAVFSKITTEYGEGYRDAINTYQERELRKVFGYLPEADAMVLGQIPADGEPITVVPFAMAMATKIIVVNEVSFNLDIDMVPNVASQLLPESNPFFHDLAQELLTKDGEKYGRFYITTADLRVIEVSRSYMADKAVLVRLIK